MPSTGRSASWVIFDEAGPGSFLDPSPSSPSSTMIEELTASLRMGVTNQAFFASSALAGGASTTGTTGSGISLTATQITAMMDQTTAAIGQGQAAQRPEWYQTWLGEPLTSEMMRRSDVQDAMRYYTSYGTGGHQSAPRRIMDFRDIGYILEEQVSRAVEKRVRELVTMPPPLTIDALKALLAKNPEVLHALVLQVCSDSTWLTAQMDNYFSAEPTALFTEAVKEALQPTGETV